MDIFFNAGSLTRAEGTKAVSSQKLAPAQTFLTNPFKFFSLPILMFTNETMGDVNYLCISLIAAFVPFTGLLITLMAFSSVILMFHSDFN